MTNRKIIESLLKTYGGLSGVKNYATQIEKDIFVCAERAIQVSYDKFLLQNQHNIDNIIQKSITDHRISKKPYIVKKTIIFYQCIRPLTFWQLQIYLTQRNLIFLKKN